MKRVIFMLSFLAGGCAYHMAPIVSSTGLAEQEIPLRVVTGEAKATYVFGMGPVSGDDSIQAAVADAISKGKGGDSLANVFVHQEARGLMGLVMVYKTRVTGTLVRYAKISDGDREASASARKEALSRGASQAGSATSNAEMDSLVEAVASLAPNTPIVMKSRSGKTYQGIFLGKAGKFGIRVRLTGSRGNSESFVDLENLISIEPVR